MKRTYHQSVYLNTIFLLLIFIFTAATLLRPQKERSETENRSLQKRPQLTWDSLISGEFAEKYEDYLSDQFILRDSWITLKTGVERTLLKQEINDVYFGADDYLIEKHTGSFTSDTASQNIARLSAFLEQAVGQLGADHVTCMIVPNAVDILRDRLPACADPYDEEDYLEQVRAAVPEGVWMDASAVLREAASPAGEDTSASQQPQLYYRTDHHWTTFAAYQVFEQWRREKGIGDAAAYTASAVTDSFEGTIAAKLGIHGRADTIERYDPAEPFDYYLVYNQSDDIRNSVYQERYLETRDKYAYFYGGNYGLVEARMPDARTGRRLLIIKDSYAHCFAPFTYACFDEVDMVDPRYYNASIQQLISEKSYTDVLFLFNAAGFAEESALARLHL